MARIRGEGGWRGAIALSFALVVALSGAAQLTALFPTYEERGILSPLLVTAVFAIYVVGVLGMLVLGKAIAPRFGRRPLLAAALGAILLSDVMFYLAQGPWLLLAGRLFSGAGVGVFAAIGSLAIIDQLGEEHEARATLLAACSTVFGLGFGAVLGGAVAVVGSDPLRLPFLVHGALVLAGCAALFLAAPTVDRADHPRIEIALPRIPNEARGAFIPAAIAAFAAFSVGGFFGALAPSVMTQQLGYDNPLVIGAFSSLVFFGAVFGDFIADALSPGRAPLVGTALLGAGAIVIGIGLHFVSLPALVAGAAIAGLGNGTAVQAGIASIKAAAKPENETEAVTLFFIVCYSALAIPILGAGLARQLLPFQAVMLGFAGLVVAMTAIALALLVRRLRRS